MNLTSFHFIFVCRCLAISYLLSLIFLSSYLWLISYWMISGPYPIVLWNGIKPLSYLLHLIIVWSCGHYYKVQEWTHIGHIVNTLISFHLIHNAAYTCLSFYLLSLQAQQGVTPGNTKKNICFVFLY